MSARTFDTSMKHADVTGQKGGTCEMQGGPQEDGVCLPLKL